MNRFQKPSRFSLHNIWRTISVVFFCLFFAFFFYGIQTAEHTTEAEQTAHLERVIRRSVIQCYVMEGSYPPSLDYLKEHYGLSYDSSQFFVDYIPIGSNIMPDITIIPRKGDTFYESKNRTAPYY